MVAFIYVSCFSCKEPGIAIERINQLMSYKCGGACSVNNIQRERCSDLTVERLREENHVCLFTPSCGNT